MVDKRFYKIMKTFFMIKLTMSSFVTFYVATSKYKNVCDCSYPWTNIWKENNAPENTFHVSKCCFTGNKFR